MSTCSNAHAKVKNGIFDVQFPGNWFGSSSILNDFSRATICAFQIQVSFPGIEDPKIPGIHPNYDRLFPADDRIISGL